MKKTSLSFEREPCHNPFKTRYFMPPFDGSNSHKREPPPKKMEKITKEKIIKLRKRNCWNCKFEVKIPGDCHVQCSNPPNKVMEIGSGGDERWVEAAKAAKEKGVIVRCIWPKSGFYPLSFDGATVFACNHFKKTK